MAFGFESLNVEYPLARTLEAYLNAHYMDDSEGSIVAKDAALPSKDLENLVNHMGETFSQKLLRFIDEGNLKDSDVYKKANVDRKLFSKIRKDENYSPSKKTVLAFAIALELSLNETDDLLQSAGFALSDSSKFDVIIEFFIENKRHDLFEINQMLFIYNQPLLGQ